MMKFLLVSTLLLGGVLRAQSVDTYTGKASANGKFVYSEEHLVNMGADSKVLSAETLYYSPQRKLLAKISSDFTSSLTAPDHVIENFISGNKHGLRRVDSKLILFDQDKGQPERTKEVTEKRDNFLVGCQGLHYYLIDNFSEVMQKKSLPVTLLVPGSLDSYDFQLNFLKESANGDLDFELVIRSWWLKVFAPKLSLKYNKNTKRLLWYSGLSNVPDENGKIQNVEITYDYPVAKN